MSVMNLLAAATQFAAAAEGIKIAEHEIIEAACEMLEGKAIVDRRPAQLVAATRGDHA
jgi:hypothetical protein